MRVSTTYIPYSSFALFWSLGTSLSTTGPGLSALRRCREWPFSLLLAVLWLANAITPIPQASGEASPVQKAHIRASTSVSMLDPVVVNPETVSKKLSTKLGICPLI